MRSTKSHIPDDLIRSRFCWLASACVYLSDFYFFFFFGPGEGVISSIGTDGTGYKRYKTGPGLLISFTYTENILLWVTLDKGKDGSTVCFDGLGGGCLGLGKTQFHSLENTQCLWDKTYSLFHSNNLFSLACGIKFLVHLKAFTCIPSVFIPFRQQVAD